jgi:hypothetical protein
VAKIFPALGKQPLVAFGPEMPDWGSWQWIGADLQQELSKYYRTASFTGHVDPSAYAVVIVKHSLPLQLVEELSRHSAVIYCPVDFYGSAAEIDAEAQMLRKCSRILVHSDRLRRYFESYAAVEYMDHHAKFVAPMRKTYRPTGFILWVGVRTNLPPLAEWLKESSLLEELGELRVLTNFEDPKAMPQAEKLEFRSTACIKVENWSRERQIKLTRQAKAALDIKGTDFRSRHKPPAKAIDFLASGLPLAMNPDSSAVEHLARMGFEICSPENIDRWLSKEYWEETQRFGKALRELLSLERIGRRWKRIIDEVLAER